MKQYIVLSLCIFFGFPVVAMEIDSGSCGDKSRHPKQPVMGAIPSLHDLCCNAIGQYGEALNTNTVSFGDIPNHSTEKVFHYLLNPQRLDKFIGLLQRIEKSKQSQDQRFTFSDEQSGLAALMVEQLSRNNSLGKEKRQLLHTIKKSPALQNSHQRLAQALVGRRSISLDEIALIERMTKNLPYNVNELSPFEKTWNSLIKTENTTPLYDRYVSDAVMTLKVAKKPFFDTMLLNFNYLDYKQLKEKYLVLRSSWIECSPKINRSLAQRGIQATSLTIDEFIAFKITLEQ